MLVWVSVLREDELTIPAWITRSAVLASSVMVAVVLVLVSVDVEACVVTEKSYVVTAVKGVPCADSIIET